MEAQTGLDAVLGIYLFVLTCWGENNRLRKDRGLHLKVVGQKAMSWRTEMLIYGAGWMFIWCVTLNMSLISLCLRLLVCKWGGGNDTHLLSIGWVMDQRLISLSHPFTCGHSPGFGVCAVFSLSQHSVISPLLIALGLLSMQVTTKICITSFDFSFKFQS